MITSRMRRRRRLLDAYVRVEREARLMPDRRRRPEPMTTSRDEASTASPIAPDTAASSSVERAPGAARGATA